MKMIGIKLADGSFYPLLEEGVPAKKTLDLTTARDNQTAIMVDLYRSETSSMEDAEYAATLQIDNLVAHPNGEPDISFTVALDEENKLFAEINDGESGGHNTVTVSLVEGASPPHPNGGDRYGPAITSGSAIASGGLMRAVAAQEDVPIEAPDFSDLDLPEELDLTKPVSESASDVSDAANDTSGMLPADDMFVPPEISSTEETDESGSAAESFDTVYDTDFGDIDLSTAGAELQTEQALDGTVGSSAAEDSAGIALADNAVSESNAAESTVAAKSPAVDDSDDFHFDAADLPSFDEAPSAQSDARDTDAASGDDAFSDDFFDGIDMPSKKTDTATWNIDSLDDLQFGETDDIQTKEGTTATKYQSEKTIKKKTKVPVLICLLCALICVIATILILFVIPSKYNVLLSRASHGSGAVVLPPQDTQALPQETEVLPAKTDEIVVAPRAETVAPVRPTPAPKSTGDVAYRIKWGDTLWDIADAYYKNPWRYPRIARYNNIKNPDYIISGTTILIPVE